jgi:hypothetical protein
MVVDGQHVEDRRPKPFGGPQCSPDVGQIRGYYTNLSGS